MLVLARGRPLRLTPHVRCFLTYDPLTGTTQRETLPLKHGLYDPKFERDSCGVGMIAEASGVATHTSVVQAIEALKALEHRGASANGAGDGVGILTQIPHLFFRKYMDSKGLPRLDAPTDLGVGVLFMPPSGAVPESTRMEMEEQVRAIVGQAGIELLAWRDVPVGDYALDPVTAAARPQIAQLLMRRPDGLAGYDDSWERLLFLTRKRLESKFAGLPFYSPSFSSRTIVYKGLVAAPKLSNLFPDLNDSDFQSAIALFHQRYSTNTWPQWFSAQPFRSLAHNGEINTLQGNINWMAMREKVLASPLFGDDFKDLLPIVQPGGSDSAALDNVLELLMHCGREPMHAMAMLVPEAYENNVSMPADLRAFYDYHRTLMEPWDGPASLVYTDGRYACASLDRNGLRPLRVWQTDRGKVIIGSEIGLVNIPQERIKIRTKLGPGEMIAVDTVKGDILTNFDIKENLSKRKPYKAWLQRSVKNVDPTTKGLSQSLSIDSLIKVLTPIRSIADAGAEGAPAAQAAIDNRARKKKAFGYTKEDETLVLGPMSATAHEPIGSMGDDTPLAAFSGKPQMLSRYFKQRFAEVTNPPIDPLLERHTMSLQITLGRKAKLLEDANMASSLVRFQSPIITEAQLEWLLTQPDFAATTLPCLFDASSGPEGLEPALDALCEAAAQAVDDGANYLVLSDRGVNEDKAPIPMLLAVGAVNRHLDNVGRRMKASIIVSSAEPREDHHIATLIGYGASLVHPYMAFETVAELAQKAISDGTAKGTVESALWSYRKALQDGLLRIMSKMGISTVDSYRGAQIFETIGLKEDFVEKFFTGTTARLGVVGAEELARDVLTLHQQGYGEPVTYKRGTALPRSGLYNQAKGGEFHSLNPLVFNKLRATAIKSGEPGLKAFMKFAEQADGRPLTYIRDGLDYVRAPGGPIPLEDVESEVSIASRFCTQAMSHGSVSRETHEMLSHAANMLGHRSNTGEGGEDSIRFKPYETDIEETDHAQYWHSEWKPKKGSLGNSKIKQVASARFGVTPNYLINAQQLEIKMAQGSKPGEGGHLPGHKVHTEIANNRHSPEGATLISPPPHHDIYSIEDLKQLIYDLKRVNDTAPVCVKLVSEAGVGTIAAGVVKAHADIVQISGHDGGTGASPLSSVKNAGLPWELGLAETQQTLVKNGLREQVTLRVDGGFKTGRDVIVAALLGAEEYGFGTAALVALGCVMARKCHLNTCPVGIATQDPELRKKFKGKPEHVVDYLIQTAHHVRKILAEMGYESLDDIIGRTDLLVQHPDLASPKGPVDLSTLLVNPPPDVAIKATTRDARRPDDTMVTLEDGVDYKHLDQLVWHACKDQIDAAAQGKLPVNEWDDAITMQFPIRNSSRSIGARLSGEIARRTGDAGLQKGNICLNFHGIAGQSFGAFCNRGMKLTLRGEAHDFVGKGMYGGVIALSPQEDTAARFLGDNNVIMGNTSLFGATGGKLFAAGRAGERFAVRNSGAEAVVEGVGMHAAEYMTNGTLVVIGRVGDNFGAGMSGGVAYVFDPEDKFLDRYNDGMVEPTRLERGSADEDKLVGLIKEHLQYTSSARASKLLAIWEDAAPFFWVVRPNTEPLKADSQAMVHIPNWDARRNVVVPVGEYLEVDGESSMGDDTALFGRFGQAEADPARARAIGLLNEA